MKKTPKFLLASNRSEAFTSFRGPLSTFNVIISVDRNKGFLRRWVVLSQGKRITLIQYLFGKLLWDELNSIEKELFWNLDEVTRDVTIFNTLRALNAGTPRKLLRERLEKGSFLGLWFITRQQYLTLKGRVDWILYKETINLRKVPKYSGYTKHHNDHGSLAPAREEIFSELLEPYEDMDESSIFDFLTVGELGFRGNCIFTLTRPKKVETDTLNAKKEC